MDREKMLKSFANPDEKLAFAKILDCYNTTLKQHKQVFSGFLDPAKMTKFVSILPNSNQGSLIIKSFGGHISSERKMLGFSPEYKDLDENDFPITCINIAYNASFRQALSHRDFLGSIMGLGIDRSNVGDIFIFDDHALAFINVKMSPYILDNLQKVGSAKVTTKIVDIENIHIPEEDKEIKKFTVSSTRVDSVISKTFGISRSKSLDLIEGEKVLLNWVTEKSGSKLLKSKDIITVRGFGRIEIVEIGELTKKGKTIIFVSVLGK